MYVCVCALRVGPLFLSGQYLLNKTQLVNWSRDKVGLLITQGGPSKDHSICVWRVTEQWWSALT